MMYKKCLGVLGLIGIATKPAHKDARRFVLAQLRKVGLDFCDSATDDEVRRTEHDENFMTFSKR